jgi:hypothetical protein
MVEERKLYRVLVGKHEGKRALGNRDVGGKMGSQWLLERLAGGIEWIELAQNKDRWRPLVNTVMSLRVLAPRS